MTLLIFTLLLCAQQTDSNEKATPTESPEHAFARQQYEGQTVRYNDNRNEFRRLMGELTQLQGCSTQDCLAARLADIHLVELIQSYLPGISQLLELLKNRLDHTDECVDTYRNTIDKKASDLTIRQADLVQSCKSVGLYPPQK